jgi:hypothetical protein
MSGDLLRPADCGGEVRRQPPVNPQKLAAGLHLLARRSNQPMQEFRCMVGE